MPKTDTIIAIKPEAEKGERRKGAITVDQRDDLGRRRTAPSGKFLRIFDLGQLVSGSDTSFSATDDFAPPALYWLVTGIDGRAGDVVLSSDLVDAASYGDFILATARDVWPTTFREITSNLTPYHFSISNLGAFVSGKGIVIPEEIVSLRGDGDGDGGIQWTNTDSEFFPAWLYDPPVGSGLPYKTTLEASYGAASATLTIDKSVDLFMAPLLWHGTGRAKNAGATLPAYPYLPQDHIYIDGGYRALPRSVCLNNAEWDDLYSKRYFHLAALTASQRDLLFSTFINASDGQQVDIDADLEDWVYPNYYIPLAKHHSVSPDFPRHEGTSGWTTMVSIVPGTYQAGQLIGAARKHVSANTFEWYYFWAVGAFDGAHVSRRIMVNYIGL